MSGPLRRTAARLPGAGRLRRIGDRFVRDRVEPELADLRRQVDELAGMRGLLDEHERSRHEHWARLGEIADEVGRLRADVEGVRFDLDRIMPVVAGLEVRVERLRRDTELATVGAGASSDDSAAHLLLEVRREHEQVRARLSAIAAYEERLRRLESA